MMPTTRRAPRRLTRAAILGLAIGVAAPSAPATAASPTPDIVVTQNASLEPAAGTGVACYDEATRSTTETHVFRRFDLVDDHGVSDEFAVTTVSMGIAEVSAPNGPLPIEVQVWAIDPSDELLPVNLEPLGSADTTLAQADSAAVLTLPLSATVPAGKDLVLEAAAPSYGTDERVFFGVNQAGQSDQPYFTGCSFTSPVTFETIGSGSLHLVLFARGKSGECSAAEVDLSEAETARNSAQTERNTAQQAVDTAAALVQTRQAQVGTAQQAVSAANAAVGAAKTTVKKRKKQVVAATSKLAAAQKDGTRAQIAQARARLTRAKAALRSARTKLSLAQQRLFARQAALAAARSELAAAQIAYQNALPVLTAAESALDEAQQVVSDQADIVEQECAQPPTPAPAP